MLIDWFTVGAQALNFLILVWLLKRFLYRPVLDAVDARERLIAGQLSDAAAKQADASAQRDEFQHKNEEFERQRAASLAKSSGEAALERQRLLDEARRDADALRARLQESLQNEHTALSGEITRKAAEEIFAIARKTLADLAGIGLEDAMVRVFLERLAALPAADKKLLQSALEAAPSSASIRSAFELSAQLRDTLEKRIGELTHNPVRIQFETVPALVSGIELTANGRKLGWSIADYLGELEKQVRASVLLKPALSQVKLPGSDKSSAAVPVAAAQ